MTEIKVDTLTGKTTAKTVTVTTGASATQSLEQGLLKAWTVSASAFASSVGDSFNNSSFTDESSAGQTTITLTNLPTGAAGLESGALYNDGGTVKVA